jgi:hypothetical protein
MTQTQQQKPLPSAETKVIAALAEARKARHHKDCHCGRFHGFCNAQDALWSRATNRILDELFAKEPEDDQ